MKISRVSIKKFRGIDELDGFSLDDLSIIVGDNGTCKTAILEAINYALSPSFLSGRIKHTDFYKGGDDPIEIMLTFSDIFVAQLPDGYQDIPVDCDRIFLRVKKRDRQANGKAFCDIVVVEHYVVPKLSRNTTKGWEIKRKSGTSKFKFDERQLSFPVKTENLIRSFYYGKNRDKQIYKGFNSSINSVFDDLNWRFSKQIRNIANTYFTDKEKLEKDIFDKIDNKVFEKTFDELNKKLKALNIDEIGVSIFDANTPFDNAFLNQKIDNSEIPISNLGSGIEMMISLMFLETIASLSKENIVIIIDEPELHLHPKLQTALIQYFTSICNNVQILINSHSPYIFMDCVKNPNTEILVTNKVSGIISITNLSKIPGLFPWSPSWGEINFNAYNLPTIEFHNELYGYIQEKNSAYTEKDFENFATSKGSSLSKSWVRSNKGKPPSLPYSVTLMTYIRHSIHHPENTNNAGFSVSELETSINEMIRIL